MSFSRPVDNLLPDSVAVEEVAYRVGIVSDTHAPERLQALPEGLFSGLAGVDLILHAGDVGELWVLDELSRIAPVIAVHGNDDTVEATTILPYTQLLTLHQQRILLWHSHYPDLNDEIASRADDDMLPKLQRIAATGAAYGATTVIFGHWHIPLVHQIDQIILLNPGAQASGNEITRQLHQTAAVLFLDRSGASFPVHFHLSRPTQPYDPRFDVDAGFQMAGANYSAPIVTNELLILLLALRKSLTREEVLQLRDSILPLAHRVWRGELAIIETGALRAAIEADSNLPMGLKTRALAALGTPRYK